jgi:hypothetical protein
MAWWARKRLAIEAKHTPREPPSQRRAARGSVPHSSSRNILVRTFGKKKSVAVRVNSSLSDKAEISHRFAIGSRPFLTLIAMLETQLGEIKSFLASLREDFLPEPQPKEHSQRLQELDDGCLVLTFQFFKLHGYVFCFAGVAQYGVPKRHRSSIVHQSRTQAHSPQRRRADLIPAALKVLFRHVI